MVLSFVVDFTLQMVNLFYVSYMPAFYSLNSLTCIYIMPSIELLYDY